MTVGEVSRSRAHGSTVVRLILGVVALLACLLSYTSPAHALPAQVTSCSGVWVVVDYGALGGTETACAASGYSTGMAALRSAGGFPPTLDNGLVVKINGLPAAPNIQENYWSYWHSTRKADGSYSSWSYSSVGPSSYHPSAGDAEGWRYAPVSGGYVAPGVLPPKQTATTQAPPTAAPATTAAGTTARTTAAATRAAATTAAQTTQGTPSASTPPATPLVTTSETQATTQDTSLVPIDSGVEGRTVAPAAPTSTSTNSLVGGVIAISAIALAAAGVLFWRKRVAAKP